MDFKGNRKYFVFNTNVFLIIGIVLIAIGAALFIADWAYLGVMPVAIGAVIIVFDFGRRTKDSDITGQIEKITHNQTSVVQDKIGLDDKKLRLLNTYEFRTFDYNDSNNILIKKGSDGKYRTSVYSACEIFFAGTQIFIHLNKFSIIEDSAHDEIVQLTYDNIDHAEIENKKCVKKVNNDKITYEIDYADVNIITNDGRKILIPASFDATTDSMVADINHFIENHKSKSNI